MQNIDLVPEKKTTNYFLSCICVITLFELFEIFTYRLKIYEAVSGQQKTYFHLREKWYIFFGCSEHLVVWFYPRIQLLFCLSRYLAVFTGRND